jgi:signal transduction histidine kinase
MKTTRVFQLTALVLVVISVLTIGWWVIDLRGYIAERTRDSLLFYEQEVVVAQALLDAGYTADQVRGFLPRVQFEGGKAEASDDVVQAYYEEEKTKARQYLWESGFFLLALGACVAVISRALRAESRVVQEQDHFLAMVSHQFKTPLASLQLSLETMSMRQLSPENQRSLIDRMLSDLGRMESLVTRILDSVRLERGRVTLRNEPIDLAAAVTRVVGQLSESAAKDRVSMKVDVPPGLEILADPLAVDVVIRNLTENALAAVGPVGGGTITLSAKRLGSEVELTVRDTGVGFRPEDSGQLFQKFSRLHPGGGSSSYGTGLGLFIVRRMMQLAGGRVSARSGGVGQGAEFILAWPVAPAQEAR